MAQTAHGELVDRFEQFYRNYYRDAIGELAQSYPNDQRTLSIDWQDLYQFDPDIADDYLTQPDQLREHAEEALRLYDLPVDISLGQAHVRIYNLPEITEIRDIRSPDVNTLVSIQGIVRKATDVRPKIEEAAFECQRCGTLTYIPQTSDFQEPHECQGCERQGPFIINYDQSSFIDAQKLRVQERPEGLRGGETPQSIDIHIEDDITGRVTPGDHVLMTGVLRIEQQQNGNQKSRMFDVYMDGHSIVVEDEEFESMDITSDDKQAIIELSETDDIYERMVESIAPSIYGYDEEKLAMVLQLFSGITKHLPDETRIRGDLHLLLVGDPGTGKCQKGDTLISLADGSEKEIGKLVESNLTDPKPVDDGVWDETNFVVPSVDSDGSLTHKQVTRVWKREAPDQMIRIKTSSGNELEVTPSHPVFIQSEGRIQPVRSDELSKEEFIAVPSELLTNGRDAEDVDGHGITMTAGALENLGGKTNTDVIPNIGEELREVREALALSQFESGIPRTMVQHYEWGDRNPSRRFIRSVIETFEERLAWLWETKDRIKQGDWKDIVEISQELDISQQSIAEGMTDTQSAISYLERNSMVPDGGRTENAKRIIRTRIKSALSVEPLVRRLRGLVESDVAWDRIESIDVISPDYDWVYDLEVEDTHTYIANNVVSHNSQLLQYIQHIAPRSVYTSGKGSSAAGLCVTGDTVIHTESGFRQLRDIAESHHPEPVTTDAPAEESLGVYTFNRSEGTIELQRSSHVWRMPKKPCQRIQTSHGKELEASKNTPVLTYGEDGIQWTPITDVTPGDYVAVPNYQEIERSSPPIQDYFEFINEKVKLSENSLGLIRQKLYERFGTLQDAAADIAVSEAFMYSHLWNRYVPIDKLDAVLDATEIDYANLVIERSKLRHGDSLRIPRRFDEDLMYLIGLVFGDGDISISPEGGNRGLVRISNSDEDMLRRAIEIFAATFDKDVEIEYQDNRVPCIRVYSATIARFFWNVGMRTQKNDLALDDRLTTDANADAFLRGLMDTDGSVAVRTNRGSGVLVTTISGELAKQIQLMLETYGVRVSRCERDKQGDHQRPNRHTIESKHDSYFVELFGADFDRNAEVIGFSVPEKQAELDIIENEAVRREKPIPIAPSLASTEVSARQYRGNFNQGENPGRDRARRILTDSDLGDATTLVEKAVESSLNWEEVVDSIDVGEKEVFDLTVPDTHNFVGNGIVTHNTAAAIRDDFADGNQWTLEAGALVLADKGVAAVDELDKMRCVTGDTVVLLGNQESITIAELVERAEDDGWIEEFGNGRTIRGVHESVLTMSKEEEIVRRPVTAVHEYDAPAKLLEVTLESGASVTTTPDHPFIISNEGNRVERPAQRLEIGDYVYVPVLNQPVASDGGTSTRILPIKTESKSVNSGVSSTTSEMGSSRDPDLEVGISKIARIRVVFGGEDTVYDISVDGTENYLANGMVVHNSEDRSAMHEALEQQSYHPSTELLLADGHRIRIGEFVDEAMDDREDEVIDGVNCEILPVDDLKIHSVDLESKAVSKLPVDRVSRHEAPDEFLRVSFDNGRSVMVTPEHPLFADRGEGLETVEARNIEEGVFVPGPRKLPNSTRTVPLEADAHRGKENDIDLPRGMSGDLAEFLGFLVAEGHSYVGSTHEIGFSNRDERLLNRVESLGQSLFGVESNSLINNEGTVTKCWISTNLYRWFESNFPKLLHTTRGKRIPAKVLGASEEEIRRFLVAAFAGDGDVEGETMVFATSSRGLADDYADALLKIGVRSRIQHNSTEDTWKTHVIGDSFERFVDAVVDPADERYEKARWFVERSNEIKRDHDVLPHSAGSEIRSLRRLLGLQCTGEFRPNFDNGYGIQVETIERHLTELRDRIKRIRAGIDDAETLRDIRSLSWWSGPQLARQRAGETEKTVYHAERGGFDKDRREDIRERAKTACTAALVDAERRIKELEARCAHRYYRVKNVEIVPNTGDFQTDWVYDVTVEPSNTFVSQGVILHNSISISKAGINATLKSRCALLGAANPKYGRFDQYQPIGEQIELDPALVSRFDLIFTVTDQPDESRDRDLAEHILKTNYAGELNTQRIQLRSPEISQDDVDQMTETVQPSIDPELFRKYIAYAKRNVFPSMTDEAREAIQEFYVNLRSQGMGEDAPVPITARKLEALVRLGEASARVRLSDTVEQEDAERVIEIIRSSLRDIGVDPETGQFDADVIETGTSKTQRDRIKNVRALIEEIEAEYEDGAPFDEVVSRAADLGMDRSRVEHEIENLKQSGELYEPRTNHLRST